MPTTNSIYGMRRANGDWFALKKHGGLRVPVFSSNKDAIQARMFNVEMLVFRPVILDGGALNDLAAIDHEESTHFWLVESDSPTLRRGQMLTYAELLDVCER